jgi:hypothetical protein
MPAADRAETLVFFMKIDFLAPEFFSALLLVFRRIGSRIDSLSDRI